MNHKTDLDTKDEEFNIDLGDVPTYHVDSANGSHKGAEARGSSFEDQAGIFNEPGKNQSGSALHATALIQDTCILTHVCHRTRWSLTSSDVATHYVHWVRRRYRRR